MMAAPRASLEDVGESLRVRLAGESKGKTELSKVVEADQVRAERRPITSLRAFAIGACAPFALRAHFLGCRPCAPSA